MDCHHVDLWITSHFSSGPSSGWRGEMCHLMSCCIWEVYDCELHIKWKVSAFLKSKNSDSQFYKCYVKLYKKNILFATKLVKMLKNKATQYYNNFIHKKIVIVPVLPCCRSTRHHIQEEYFVQASSFKQVPETGKIGYSKVAGKVSNLKLPVRLQSLLSKLAAACTLCLKLHVILKKMYVFHKRMLDQSFKNFVLSALAPFHAHRILKNFNVHRLAGSVKTLLKPNQETLSVQL